MAGPSPHFSLIVHQKKTTSRHVLLCLNTGAFAVLGPWLNGLRKASLTAGRDSPLSLSGLWGGLTNSERSFSKQEEGFLGKRREKRKNPALSWSYRRQRAEAARRRLAASWEGGSESSTKQRKHRRQRRQQQSGAQDSGQPQLAAQPSSTVRGEGA